MSNDIRRMVGCLETRVEALMAKMVGTLYKHGRSLFAPKIMHHESMDGNFLFVQPTELSFIGGTA